MRNIIININLFVIFLLVLLPFQSKSQTTNSSDISFDYFLQEDGLPNNRIHCIYQDKKGWIWIGKSQVIKRQFRIGWFIDKETKEFNIEHIL